jgi:hypothetical protein
MVRKPFENFLSADGQRKNKQVMEQGLRAIQVSSRRQPYCAGVIVF